MNHNKVESAHLIFSCQSWKGTKSLDSWKKKIKLIPIINPNSWNGSNKEINKLDSCHLSKHNDNYKADCFKLKVWMSNKDMQKGVVKKYKPNKDNVDLFVGNGDKVTM